MIGAILPAPLHIPAPWQRSAERILSAGWRRILVVGASDRGKSSYCNFLLGALLGEGRTVSFVDADIGQKDVGPPATVSLADVKAPTDLAASGYDALYFVGHTNPIAHFLPLVLGTRRMAEAAKGEFVLIDTTGLVQGRGRDLKGFQIDSLQPDALVCLERGEELAPIRHAARHCHILRLPPSRLAATKSPNARRRAREQAFQSHFRGARELSLDLERLIVQRSSLFNGQQVDDPRFLYAEQLPDRLVAVAEASAPAALEGVHVLPRQFADQLLCGVADGTGSCLGLGLVVAIDFARGTLALYTPVPKRRIRIVQFGDIYLDREGRELHHGRLGHF